MTAEQFAQLFTREGLHPFEPRPGSAGFLPMLEVYTTAGVQVVALDLPGFHDGPTRQHYLQELGTMMGGQHEILAVRFGSEAWTRRFTEEEVAARGDRRVASYPDREECMLVLGQRTEGLTTLARAPLHRRPDGTVSHLGPWDVQTTSYYSALLDAFWDGVAAAAPGGSQEPPEGADDGPRHLA